MPPIPRLCWKRITFRPWLAILDLKSSHKGLGEPRILRRSLMLSKATLTHFMWLQILPMARASPHLHSIRGCRRPSKSSLPCELGDSCPTDQISRLCSGALPTMSIRFCAVPSRGIYQSSSRPNSIWSSTSRQPRCLASTCQTRCNCWPTRSSNEASRVCHASWRSDNGVATRCARATASDSGSRISQQSLAQQIRRGNLSFRRGLKEKGFVEGQNVVIAFRWAEGAYNRLPSLADELVALRIAVLFAAGGQPSALAAKAATSTVPVVFSAVNDPDRLGLVASFNRPGGNVPA